VDIAPKDLVRFESKFTRVPESGCWLWEAGVKRGYGVFTMGSRRWLAHRISYRAYIGEIPDAICVLHRCDVTSCVNPAHLFIGTRSDNQADMTAKGRGVVIGRPGSSHPMAKLTESQVLAIRADTRLHREIAAEYGIARSHISTIKNRKRRWLHI
jgi:hypothetical protein